MLFDQATYDKLVMEEATYRLVIPSFVSERMKVLGSLAHKALGELLEKGLIKQVVADNAQLNYTCLIKDNEEEAVAVTTK